MKTHQTKAIVLRRTNYGEADRILQFITPSGKISAIARGVRKEKSRLSGGVELFSICDIVVGEGKGEIGTLVSTKLDIFFRHIIEDYDRMRFGYQVVDLISKASEMIDDPSWYDILAETLSALDVQTISMDLIKTWFYLRYSSMLGHELSLFYDIDGKELLSDKKYIYDESEKGLAQNDNGDLNSDHIKLMRLVATKSIKVLVQIGGIGEIIKTCALIARQHTAVKTI